MKVLIVASKQTHPTDAGNRAAIMAQVTLLERLGHDVHFLFVNMSLKSHLDFSQMRMAWGDKYYQYDQPVAGRIKRLFVDKYRQFFCSGHWKMDDHYPEGLEKYVNNLNDREHFDAVIIQYLSLSKLLPLISIPRKAVFTHDVFADKDIKTGGPFYETCTVEQESRAARRCPVIFSIQEEETSYFKTISPDSDVKTVFCSFSTHCQPVVQNNNILFLASRMQFNVDGILWFLENVWERLLAEIPSVKLIIGGSVCEKIPLDKYKNVEFLGVVDSLEDFYSLGNVAINPVRSGTGLKIKTFEALSFGKVTVADSHSTSGIFDKENAPVVVCKSADDWLNSMRSIMDERNFQEWKERDMSYIERMNRHIENQYSSFVK